MWLSLYPRMLCCVFWSQVEYGIVYFISVSGMGFSAGGSVVPEVT